MLDPSHPLAELLKRDRRYKFPAYVFVDEALAYAHNELGLGAEQPAEDEGEGGEEGAAPERHVTGQELCEAMRQYALEQYGYMAKVVLNSWGVHSTGDIGNIVFNLIDIGRMRKTEQDRREDFDDVFDFDADLQQGFRITAPEEPS